MQQLMVLVLTAVCECVEGIFFLAAIDGPCVVSVCGGKRFLSTHSIENTFYKEHIL